MGSDARLDILVMKFREDAPREVCERATECMNLISEVVHLLDRVHWDVVAETIGEAGRWIPDQVGRESVLEILELQRKTALELHKTERAIDPIGKSLDQIVSLFKHTGSEVPN